MPAVIIPPVAHYEPAPGTKEERKKRVKVTYTGEVDTDYACDSRIRCRTHH